MVVFQSTAVVLAYQRIARVRDTRRVSPGFHHVYLCYSSNELGAPQSDVRFAIEAAEAIEGSNQKIKAEKAQAEVVGVGQGWLIGFGS